MRTTQEETILTDIERRLAPYVDEAARTIGRGITIDRTYQLARLAGNPQDDLRVVHIAGTSGKTSTTYFVTALLRLGGARVGTTVSPHIDSITERVQIDGRPLDSATFERYFDEFMSSVVDAMATKPTYFEILIVFALWVFSRKKVDYAVLETGLGGLEDSTNIVGREDKICVITDIGLDHMHVLGTTILEIAEQKFGIVKPRNIVLMHQQTGEVMRVAEQTMCARQASLVIAPESHPDPAMAMFQQRNWSLAKSVYDALASRDGLSKLTPEQLSQSRQVYIPGRIERLDYKGQLMILDGAHNAQKMRAFVDSFRELYPGLRPVVIMALKLGKELSDVAPIAAELTDTVIAVSAAGSQDTRNSWCQPDDIVHSLESHGVSRATAVDSVEAALTMAMRRSPEMIVVTGSLYLVSSIKKLIATSRLDSELVQ